MAYKQTKAAGRFGRHSEANSLVKKALASIEITSTLEPLGLSTTDGKRPDGLTHFTWKGGKPLIWDWTTSCTVAPSNLSLSLKGAGKTAEARETSKCEKYAELTNNYHFTPISSETFGAWGPMTLKFLSDIGKELIAHTGEKRSGFFLLQRLGICIQKKSQFSNRLGDHIKHFNLCFRPLPRPLAPSQPNTCLTKKPSNSCSREVTSSKRSRPKMAKRASSL